MPYKERPVGKIFWSIGEVADQLQVGTSVLRHWEKEFGMLRPRRDGKGDRLFTEADIRKVRMIHYLLKHRRFTIEGAREQLRLDPEGTERMAELRERLLRVRDLLVRVGDGLGAPGSTPAAGTP